MFHCSKAPPVLIAHITCTANRDPHRCPETLYQLFTLRNTCKCLCFEHSLVPQLPDLFCCVLSFDSKDSSLVNGVSAIVDCHNIRTSQGRRRKFLQSDSKWNFQKCSASQRRQISFYLSSEMRNSFFLRTICGWSWTYLAFLLLVPPEFPSSKLRKHFVNKSAKILAFDSLPHSRTIALLRSFLQSLCRIGFVLLSAWASDGSLGKGISIGEQICSAADNIC